MIDGEKNAISDRYLVESISLDEFVKKHGVVKIDAIKMDIQGHEGVALEGGERSIRSISSFGLC